MKDKLSDGGFKDIIEHYKETSYTSPLSFDVFTQNHEDYISEFNQKCNELDKLTKQYELEYYSWLKDVSNYVFNGIDYNKPPTDEVRELLNIDAEILRKQNPKKVYENCFWIVDFLEQQKVKTSEPQQSEKGAEENKDKEPTKKDDYLFEIGLKLATGELDEYLIFDKDGKCTGANMSYPKLATKFNLDPQHLKCTLSDYNDQSNRSKNLLYNPEIIEKVLTHLKSEGKEPKEWFLNKFKK